ncbi:MAG: protein kinase, partial [Planctomycetales bacterium]|nr:protein kinase [Planctomycetales bacterium]
LRDGTVEESFSAEPQMRLAMAKALGALAVAEDALTEELPSAIGEYEVLRCLGRGGMGAVYLARHTKLNRSVALKVLAGHRKLDPRMHDRFQAEMRAAGRLSHPNIVAAHDAREVDGVAVLVTEWIDGLDASELVRRVGPLRPEDACEIGAKIAVALQAIDREGLVHRDIKPSNVMISRTGEVKLLDLGLARFITGDEGADATSTGLALGTADYISPEQVNSARDADIRADIYGLGCSLYKLLSGRAPFAHEQTAFAKMTAHVSRAPAALQSVSPATPAAVAQLVDQMLTKKPEQRPALDSVITTLEQHAQSADLAALLRGAEASEPQAVQAATLSAAPRRAAVRQIPLRSAVVATLAAAVLAFAGGMLAGVLIRIKHADGTTTALNVAPGSQVDIDKDGNPTVTPPAARTPRGEDASKVAHNGELPQTNADSGEEASLSGPGGQSGADQIMRYQALRSIAGIWQVVALTVEGESLPLASGQYFVFGDNGTLGMVNATPTQLLDLPTTVKGNGKTPDPKDDMAAIPHRGLYRVTGEGEILLQFNGEARRAIFRMQSADRTTLLQLCIAPQGRTPRSFSSTKENQHQFLLLQRTDFRQTPREVQRAADALAQAAPSDQTEAMTDTDHTGAIAFPDLQQILSSVWGAKKETQSRRNLQALAIAFHNFHDAYRVLPNSKQVQQSEGEGMLPPYSWRVAILPFIGEQKLFEQYRLNEPWDSEHNKQLLSRMPAAYRNPSAPADTQFTSYVGVVGEGLSMDDSRPLAFHDFHDGTSNTLLLVEAQTNIPWTKPEDFSLEQLQNARPYGKSLQFSMADGAPRSLSLPLDAKLLRAFATISGRERVLHGPNDEPQLLPTAR